METTLFKPGCRWFLLFTVLSARSFVAADEGSTNRAQIIRELNVLPFDQLLQVEVTTVTRSESTVGQSAAAITVITAEEIRRSGATTIAEVLRRVPGMSVARIDANKWAISARGFNDRFANKLLVQLDGRTLYNALFSGTYWDTVDYPLEDIERIEIIRGPGASVWGANAVNGVINIITKAAKDSPGGLVVAGGGTEEQGFGTLRYGGPLRPDLAYRVYAKGFNRDEQFFADGDPHDQWWGTSGGLRLDWQATQDDALTLQGDYVRSVVGRRDLRPQIAPPFQFTNLEDETTNEGNLLGRWTRQLSATSNWALQAYWDRFDRESSNRILISAYDLYDLDYQFEFALGTRQKIVTGAAYRLVDSWRRASFENGFIFGFNDLTRHTQLASAFVQDEIALVPSRLSLLLGSKVEYNDFTGFEVQPTARLAWTPTTNHTVWAAVSRAVRTPSINEDNSRLTFLPLPGTSIFLQAQPSPKMRSEDLLAYELGYRAQLTRRIALDLALFYNDYNHLRSSQATAPVPGPDGTTLVPVYFTNQLRGETYGTELAAQWQLTDWWRLYGAYSFLETQLHRSALLPASAEAAEGQTPRHQFYLQSCWNLGRQIEFDLIGRYVDQLSGFNPSGFPGTADQIPSYVSLDIRAAWQIRPNLTLSVVGQNLLDEHHSEFGTNPFIRSPLVQIERGLYAKLTWQF